jgi:DNA (cytosine-5)-methyltransferase 1
MKIGVIDLFCGIGGLSYGFHKRGFRMLAGVDSDESCKYAFEANIKAPFIAKSVSDLKAVELKRLFAEANVDKRVLIGCAPCQPFSIYSGPHQKKGKDDDRWALLREFSRLALAVKPDVISMENVPRLKLHPIFDEFVGSLQKAGYKVSFGTMRAEQFGVPQRRSRLVLLASLNGTIDLPEPTHIGRTVTVRQAIGHLPPVEAGETSPVDRLHSARNLTLQNLDRLKSTKEGGSWKDWDEALQLDCHKKDGGKSFRSVYGRMNWDAPAPVITTQCLGIGNGRFGHPKQNRAITIREAALLQSFPKSFKFVKPRQPVIGLHLARQIGNAVPVKLGTAIAKAIHVHLRDAS